MKKIKVLAMTLVVGLGLVFCAPEKSDATSFQTYQEREEVRQERNKARQEREEARQWRQKQENEQQQEKLRQQMNKIMGEDIW